MFALSYASCTSYWPRFFTGAVFLGAAAAAVLERAAVVLTEVLERAAVVLNAVVVVVRTALLGGEAVARADVLVGDVLV